MPGSLASLSGQSKGIGTADATWLNRNQDAERRLGPGSCSDRSPYHSGGQTSSAPGAWPGRRSGRLRTDHSGARRSDLSSSPGQCGCGQRMGND